MGRYASASDIYSKQVYRLTSTVANTDTVNYYIGKAEAEVDSYLSKVYSMPIVASSLSSVPPLVESLTQDLAAYKIMQWQYSGDNQNASDWVEALGEDVYSTLDKIVEEEIGITDEDGNTIQAFNGMSSNMEDIPSVINLDDELNWKVSNDLLDQISSDRDYAG